MFSQKSVKDALQKSIKLSIRKNKSSALKSSIKDS
jgi:hypothetical protein